MNKRIADIVTRFRAEGLGPVRAALQQVAASAKKTRAETSRLGQGMDTGIGRSAVRIRHHFGRIEHDGVRAFGAISIAAGEAFSEILDKVGDVGEAIAETLGEVGKGAMIAGLVGVAGTAAGVGSYKAVSAVSPLLTGGLSFLSAALAGFVTIQDAMAVQDMTETLGVSPEVAGQWQLIANRVGLVSDDITGSMQNLKSSMVAALDPSSDLAKLFQRIGVPVKDATGQLRNASHVMFDVAEATQNLNAAQRAFALKEIFGEADAAKINGLLLDIGKNRAELLAEFQKNKADGLFITRDQMDRISAFQGLLAGFVLPLKAFARELFLAFEPFFTSVLGSLEMVFRDPQERARIIREYFVKPFQQGYQLLNDLLRVFTGFDINKAIYGIDSAPVVNTWVFAFKQFLVDALAITKGLGVLFLGLGAAILDIAKLIDGLVLRATGIRIEDWFKRSGPEDIEAFFRDLGQIAANIFVGSYNATMLRTRAGRWVGELAQDFKSYLAEFAEPLGMVFDYIVDAMADLGRAGGLESATTALGKFLIMAREAVSWFARLAPAIADVFISGKSAPEGFAALDDIKATADYFLGVFREVSDALKPIFAEFDAMTKATVGLSGGAALIVGAVGSQLASKIMDPKLLAAAGVAFGVAAGREIANSFIGTFNPFGAPTGGANYGPSEGPGLTPEDLRRRGASEEQIAALGAQMPEYQRKQISDFEEMKANSAATKQAVVNFFKWITLQDGGQFMGRTKEIQTDPDNRTIVGRMRDIFTSGIPAIVNSTLDVTRALARGPDDRAFVSGALEPRQPAHSMPDENGTKEGDLGKVDVIARGTPVNLTINGTTATGIFPDDEASSLLRAVEGRL